MSDNLLRKTKTIIIRFKGKKYVFGKDFNYVETSIDICHSLKRRTLNVETDKFKILECDDFNIIENETLNNVTLELNNGVFFIKQEPG